MNRLLASAPFVAASVILQCGGETSAADAGADSATDAASETMVAQGIATFSFVVNGTVQTPMTCPSDRWEFPWPSGEGNVSPFPPAPGITSVVIVNTGASPMAYVARSGWSVGSHYVPGVSSDSMDLAGVLDPGAQVDITSVYVSGAVALLGSADPFSGVDASFASDEGMIAWPNGVAGSDGASTMHIAEIEVPSSPQSTCTAAFQAW
ncbi:MAG TPA: hypothetical protein VGH28_33425 [Polyangiaceae bacterium]